MWQDPGAGTFAQFCEALDNKQNEKSTSWSERIKVIKNLIDAVVQDTTSESKEESKERKLECVLNLLLPFMVKSQLASFCVTFVHSDIHPCKHIP